MIKKIILLLLVFIISCSSNKKMINIPSSDCSFDLIIGVSNLTRSQEKDFRNYLINNSGINFNSNSRYLIDISIIMTKSDSLLSGNNTSVRNNLNFVVDYKLIDVNNKETIDSRKFVIVESVNISDYLFSNRIDELISIDNLSKNFSTKLENRINMICTAI